jgi:phenylpyruvate tautomerase PptA (4-oxalocrotonate tautomerase family)
MPYVNIRIAGTLSREQKQRLAEVVNKSGVLAVSEV